MRIARDWEDPTHGDESRGPSPIGFAPRGSLTRTLLWVLGVIGLVGLLVGDLAAFQRLFDWLALNPRLWRDWFPFTPLWQLATYGALHDTRDPTHLLFNLLALYGFGSLFEGVVGPRRMLAWFVGAVVLGGAAQLLYNLALGHLGRTVGASGAVMFLIVAMATIEPHRRVFFFIVQLRLKTLALILIGLDLLRVVWALKGQGGDVAFVVHLVGAGLGFVAVRRSWIWLDPLATLQAWRDQRRQASRQDDERRLDELLQRIHREGIGSLSGRERDFLKRMSSRRGGGL